MSEQMTPERLEQLKTLFDSWGMAYGCKPIREGGEEALAEIERCWEAFEEFGRNAERQLIAATKLAQRIMELEKENEKLALATELLKKTLPHLEFLTEGWWQYPERAEQISALIKEYRAFLEEK